MLTCCASYRTRYEETSWKEGSYTVETPDNVTLFQVSGLNPFTTYSFRVTAVTAARAKKSKPSESSFYMFTLREGWYILFSILHHLDCLLHASLDELPEPSVLMFLYEDIELLRYLFEYD